MNWIKLAYMLAALLMLQEALTETVGILLVGNGGDWIAIKNVMLLLLDLLLSLGILFSLLLGNENFPPTLVLGMCIIAITFHIGRSLEYVFAPEIAYCYYPEMFWKNNLKLGALLFALGFSFLFKNEKIDLINLKNTFTNGI